MAQENKIIKVGHRGAAGYEPENTLRSFKKAMELGADMIEFDVHLCKSGELVVIHDETVDRTTNSKGLVAEKIFAELKELNIPTIENVLDLADKKVNVNIELKGGNTARPVSDTIEKYVEEKDWGYESFLVSSFNHGELKKFKELNPKVKTGLLVEEIPEGFTDFAEKFDAYSVNVPVKYLTEEFAENAHLHNLKVYVWAANEVSEIEKAKELGADYICSNFPNKI